MATKSYDYLVIGAGSGGLASALRAREFGASVGIVEYRRWLGGTCVNAGCVPKRGMFNASLHAEMIRDHTNYGFNVQHKGFTLSVVKNSIDAYVQRLNKSYEDNLANSGIDCIRGHAKFTSPKVIDVNGQAYTAKHILIATGGEAMIPDIPGGKEYGITSHGFFKLTELPKKTAVVVENKANISVELASTAGYHAVELTGIFKNLGSDVTLFIRRENALPNFDVMISKNVTKSLEESGVNVVRHSTSVSLEKERDGTLTYTSTAGVFKGFNQVVFAVGRAPNTQGMGLEKAGIEMDFMDNIVIDEFQNTTVQGVYAVGDCCGNVLLGPVAIKAGRILAHRLFNNETNYKMDYTSIPNVVFSHPPVATVGMTQIEAETKYGADNIKIYETNFCSMYFAMTNAKQFTIVKLVCAGPKDMVVGIHMHGPGCDEMLQGFAVAVRKGSTKTDFEETVAIHPTSTAEMILSR